MKQGPLTFSYSYVYSYGHRNSQLMRFDLQNNSYENIIEGEGRLRDVFIEGEVMYIVTNNRDGRGSPHNDDDRLIKITHVD